MNTSWPSKKLLMASVCLSLSSEKPSLKTALPIAACTQSDVVLVLTTFFRGKLVVRITFLWTKTIGSYKMPKHL